MRASELIQATLRRESQRLLTWGLAHAHEDVARPAVAGALAAGWRHAITGTRTPNGPVALLLHHVEVGIKSRPARTGTYLSATARRTLTVPTLGELYDASRTYAWLRMAVDTMQLPFTHASMVIAALHAEGLDDPVQRTVLLHRYEVLEGRQVFARVLDVAEHLVKQNDEPALEAAAMARREYERARRWLDRWPAAVG